MSLDRESVRDRLDRIDDVGWDSIEGTALLSDVRHSIVRPAVRRARLSGPSAAQAESTAWAAAWVCLAGPAARAAENPAGVVSVAVRRAIWAECDFVSRSGLTGSLVGPPSTHAGPDRDRRGPTLSLDAVRASGWEPPAPAAPGSGPDSGGPLEHIVAALAEVGWQRQEVSAVVIDLANTSGTGATPRVAWRRVARRTGVQPWRVRRLGLLLLGDGTSSGLVELVEAHGSAVLREPAVHRAMRCTVCRWGPAIEERLAEVRVATSERPTWLCNDSA